MNTEIKSAEEELILKIVEQWGNAIVPISEMVTWLKEYASQFKQPVQSNVLPQIYEGKLNTERIKRYEKLHEEFNIEEGTVRRIFCEGCDWYKSLMLDEQPIKEVPVDKNIDNAADEIFKSVMLSPETFSYNKCKEILYKNLKKEVPVEEIKSNDSFIHLPTNQVFECMGTDEGCIWYEHTDFMELQKFDEGDCEKIPYTLLPFIEALQLQIKGWVDIAESNAKANKEACETIYELKKEVPVSEDKILKELQEVLDLDSQINSCVMAYSDSSYKKIQRLFWSAIEAIQKKIIEQKNSSEKIWTDADMKQFAEEYRFSSSRISLAQFKESKSEDPATEQSTANWGKVGDQDTWLNEVRGNVSEDVDKVADDYADRCGYPKSYKSQFTTTFWTQHNIAAVAFEAGWNAKPNKIDKAIELCEIVFDTLPDDDNYDPGDIISKLYQRVGTLKQYLQSLK